jgi:uncharacterized protein (DUF2267 family)
MGANLGLEVRQQCSPAAIRQFASDLVALQKALVETESRLAAIEKLANIDVKASLAPMREEARRYAGEVSKSAAAEALEKSVASLDSWFSSDESVAALEEKWSSSMDACAKRVGTECVRKLHALVASPLGGIQIDSALRSAVGGLDELLGPVVESARATLATATPSFQISALEISPEQLKVRKSVWDWLSFRSMAAVRRKTFGDPGGMTLVVPATVKEKRLGEAGRQALKDYITTALADRFPGEAASVTEELHAGYAETYQRELQSKLQAGRDESITRIAGLTDCISANQAIRAVFKNLANEADVLIDAVEQLRGKYRTSSLVESAPTLPPESEPVPFEPAPAAPHGEDSFEDFAFIATPEKS